MVEIRNAEYTDETNEIINVEIEHPEYGWIPYTFIPSQEDESFDSEIREWLKTNEPIEYKGDSEADIILNNKYQAKIDRDAAEVSNIKVHEVMWQVRDIDRTRTNETIDTAYRQGREAEKINWILADNTIRESTVKDLEDVLDAFSLRREDIFTQYAIWRSGDKLVPFVYSKSE